VTESTFSAILIASFLACGVTTAGVYIISRHEAWGRRNVVLFMSFAAGVLVSVSFIHIIPTAFDMVISAPLWLLGGFLALYLFNRFLNLYICHQHEGQECSTGITPTVGIGFHSLLDGIIYSVTFNVSVFTGVLATFGMVLHEFPEGIVTFLLLERGGMTRKRSARWAFLAAGLSTPLGAIASYPFISRIPRSALGTLLAISAGALVYVGASHLLPQVEREHKRYSVVAFLVGILVAVAVVVSKG
jgi:zinc transporter ZupT